MEAVGRAVFIYAFLWLLFRVAGKRTLAQTTTFDLVLLLIISEAAQNGLVGNDYSIVNAAILITTLVGLDIALSVLKHRSKAAEKLLDGEPRIIVVDGRPLEDRMKYERVDEADILAAARERLGLERMDQIKYAVLETDGNISIIPMPGARPDPA